METQAAVLWQTHTDWSVEDITLDPPKQGEVLVKLAASGLCHSDEHLVTEQRANASLNDIAVLVLARVPMKWRGQRARRHRVLDKGEAAVGRAAVDHEREGGAGGGRVSEPPFVMRLRSGRPVPGAFSSPPG